jgi:hypothetical protein
LLAIPFGTEVYLPRLHEEIKGRILAAVAEVTNSSTAGVIAPPPNKDASNTGQIPKTFLIYNISETHRQILLQRRVWSSINFTFQVAPLEPSCPDFLFTLRGFTTLENNGIINTVRDVWTDQATKGAIDALVKEAPLPDQEQLRKSLDSFINSMWITCLDIKTKGNCLNPEFNVYTKGSFIQDVRLWSSTRHFLAKRTYANESLGHGNTVVAPHLCGICHGRDHPRGLCPFPMTDGWPGPKRNPTAKQARGGRSRRTNPHHALIFPNN